MKVVASYFDAALKRGLDLVLAGATLTFLAPALPVLAAAIRLDSAGPIFFVCSRLGAGGKTIQLRKLRTMIHDAPERFNPDGSRLVEHNDKRVTKVGSFLRGGLDELPQVVNVLRGELSFIGPRPDDLYAIDLYRGSDWLKLSITPGITGLAQVNGRNELPYKERLKYDVYYALHRDLRLDAKIFFRTIQIALGMHPAKPLVDYETVVRVASSEKALELAKKIEDRVRDARR
jgi:undecaprenyl phosphate N,N'-diacetylbacillosamine 1-phosphate transferase